MVTVTHSSVELRIANVTDAQANSSHFLGAIDIKCINPLELFRVLQETDNKSFIIL